MASGRRRTGDTAGNGISDLNWPLATAPGRHHRGPVRVRDGGEPGPDLRVRGHGRRRVLDADDDLEPQQPGGRAAGADRPAEVAGRAGRVREPPAATGKRGAG